jgi:hypothetical protein
MQAVVVAAVIQEQVQQDQVELVAVGMVLHLDQQQQELQDWEAVVVELDIQIK